MDLPKRTVRNMDFTDRYPVFKGEVDQNCHLTKEELEERLNYELNTIKEHGIY